MKESKELLLDYEGSWALMLEELTHIAHQKYQWKMLGLDIGKCTSIGHNRYYKVFMEKEDILRNQDKMLDFLSDTSMVEKCIEKMNEIIKKLYCAEANYSAMQQADKFQYYCGLLVDYLGYYNEVFSDLFYDKFYEKLEHCIPKEYDFAKRLIYEALFATNNSTLVTDQEVENLNNLYEKYKSRTLNEEEINDFVLKYRANNSSSDYPEGLNADVVRKKLAQYDDIASQKAYNTKMRNANASSWNESMQEVLELDDNMKTCLSNVRKLSFMKTKMREAYQYYKFMAKENFLSAVIEQVGKGNFDYMTVDEISEFLSNGKVAPREEIVARRAGIIYGYKREGGVEFVLEQEICKEIEQTGATLACGNVLLGSGVHRFKVFNVKQDEQGLKELTHFLETSCDLGGTAIVTNTLRPYLIPRLKNVGAILTQQGGYTSHAAVLCRELGIKSVIGICNAMNIFATDDYIEVDFQDGTVRGVQGIDVNVQKKNLVFWDVPTVDFLSADVAGNKAVNLNKIGKEMRVPKGFVVSEDVFSLYGKDKANKLIYDKVQELNSTKVAIRSSHEAEDLKNTSFAGLFKSFVNVDARSLEQISKCVDEVFSSCRDASVELYKGILENKMHVLIQEMIEADITGVILSSKPRNGLDYIYVEYVYGDLCHLMDGNLTPYVTYIKKSDLYSDQDGTVTCIPTIIDRELSAHVYELAQKAVKIENMFDSPVEIEWGMKNGEIYIFQARAY